MHVEEKSYIWFINKIVSTNPTTKCSSAQTFLWMPKVDWDQSRDNFRQPKIAWTMFSTLDRKLGQYGLSTLVLLKRLSIVGRILRQHATNIFLISEESWYPTKISGTSLSREQMRMETFCQERHDNDFLPNSYQFIEMLV